jgi:plasmid maintenance system antidote protein VapI
MGLSGAARGGAAEPPDGNGSDLWLRMQQAHDLWRAQEQLSGELEKIPEHVAR